MKSKNQPSKIIQPSVPGLRGLQLSPHTGVVAKYLLLDIQVRQARMHGNVEPASIVQLKNLTWDVQCWDINLAQLPQRVPISAIVNAYRTTVMSSFSSYKYLARTMCLVEVKYEQVRLPDSTDKAYAALVRNVEYPESDWELLYVLVLNKPTPYRSRGLVFQPVTFNHDIKYDEIKHAAYRSVEHHCRFQKSIDLVVPANFNVFGASFMQQEILRQQNRDAQVEADVTALIPVVAKSLDRLPVTLTPEHVLMVAETIADTSPLYLIPHPID